MSRAAGRPLGRGTPRRLPPGGRGRRRVASPALRRDVSNHFQSWGRWRPDAPRCYRRFDPAVDVAGADWRNGDSCRGVPDEWHLDKRKPLPCLGLSRLCGRLPKTFLQLSISSSFCNPLDSQSSVEQHMSTEFSERPPGKLRKRLYGKALRINYVPFVDQTEARNGHSTSKGPPPIMARVPSRVGWTVSRA